MKSVYIILLLVTLYGSRAFCSGLAEERLHPPLPGNPAQEVTTEGANAVQIGNGICIIPSLGVEYSRHETESALQAVTSHGVVARAGWKLSLLDNIGVLTSAKLPLLSADENKEALISGQRRTTNTQVKSELGGLMLQNLGWRSELQLKLGERLNLNLYYDYTKGIESGFRQMFQDERIGTKLEFHFK